MDITTRQFIEMLRDTLKYYDYLQAKTNMLAARPTEEEWLDFEELNNLLERLFERFQKIKHN